MNKCRNLQYLSTIKPFYYFHSVQEMKDGIESVLKWFKALRDKCNYRTYGEKHNRIINFSKAPYMVLVVGRISTLKSLSLSYCKILFITSYVRRQACLSFLVAK